MCNNVEMNLRLWQPLFPINTKHNTWLSIEKKNNSRASGDDQMMCAKNVRMFAPYYRYTGLAYYSRRKWHFAFSFSKAYEHFTFQMNDESDVFIN